MKHRKHESDTKIKEALRLLEHMTDEEAVTELMKMHKNEHLSEARARLNVGLARNRQRFGKGA